MDTLFDVFTGIVEEMGEVVGKEDLGDAARFVIRGPVVTADAGHGDSISVNGVCLTMVEVLAGDEFSADVSHVVAPATRQSSSPSSTRLNNSKVS